LKELQNGIYIAVPQVCPNAMYVGDTTGLKIAIKRGI
jgi:hypothetical protein